MTKSDSMLGHPVQFLFSILSTKFYHLNYDKYDIRVLQNISPQSSMNPPLTMLIPLVFSLHHLTMGGVINKVKLIFKQFTQPIDTISKNNF